MRFQLIPLVLLAAGLGISRAAEIPAFTPNVVDPNRYLSAPDLAEVNSTIEHLRKDADILAAVYLTDELKGESIEQVASRSFEEWQLGDRQKNNGLLIVLAIQDRKSRIQVGIGLERQLPERVTKAALDKYLAPQMRRGEIQAALTETLEYLADQKNFLITGDEETQLETALRLGREIQTRGDSPVRGGLTYAIFLLCLWGITPLSGIYKRRYLRSLEERLPGFNRDIIKYYPSGIRNEGGHFSQMRARGFGLMPSFGPLGLKAFLTLNPGCFIFMGGMVSPWGSVGISLLTLLISYGFLRGMDGKIWFKEPRAVEDYLMRLRGTYQDKIKQGYVTRIEDGIYEYTESFFASDLYRSEMTGFPVNRISNLQGLRGSTGPGDSFSSSSSDSSFSSSDSSSSSEGGSSSGGGSSSDW